MTIPKDGSDIRIDVLDKWSCQPYDYQYILEKDSEHKIANIVKEQVEYWMEKLQEEGVLKGHVKGEYIWYCLPVSDGRQTVFWLISDMS